MAAQTPEFNLKTDFNRNIIINGNFDFWQRGTSFSPLTGAYGADRFSNVVIGAGTMNVLRSGDVPTLTESGFASTYDMTAQVGTADTSIAASDQYALRHRVEGYNAAALHDKTMTLSFWVKSSVAGIYGVGFSDTPGTRSYVAEYTINAADTWEKKEITLKFDVSSGGTWNSGNGIGLEIRWALAVGADRQATAGSWKNANAYTTSNQVNWMATSSNTFRLAQIQLVEGIEVSTFRRTGETAGEELALCQRYWRRVDYAVGVAANTTTAQVTASWPTMRATPSVSASGVLRVTDHLAADFTQSSASVTTNNLTDHGARFNMINFSGMTTGRVTSLITVGESIILSAEL